jgi:hypothetical protein
VNLFTSTQNSIAVHSRWTRPEQLSGLPLGVDVRTTLRSDAYRSIICEIEGYNHQEVPDLAPPGARDVSQLMGSFSCWGHSKDPSHRPPGVDVRTILRIDEYSPLILKTKRVPVVRKRGPVPVLRLRAQVPPGTPISLSAEKLRARNKAPCP